MSSTHIQVVKWTFPAFALIVGLFWYKRRRVDRADPGGINKPYSDTSEMSCAEPSTAAPSKPSTSLSDSGIHDESFLLSSPSVPQTEEIACTPRKRSESLDIPRRKSSSQFISAYSGSSPVDESGWCSYVESREPKMEVQLSSNPKISNFDMIARSRSANSLERAADSGGKVMKIFENVAEEEEQNRAMCAINSVEQADTSEENDASNECNYLPANEPPVAGPSQDSAKTPAQALSERDSANHSPVSGVLEGSVTDEARSEGSTDSGKGGSIKDHTKDNLLPPVTYEFSIPQHLVGKLIGRHGSFLQSIRTKAEVHIAVKRHPMWRDQKICAIDGSVEGINIALDMIRQKFPENKYPLVTLEQILPLRTPDQQPWVAQIRHLSLVVSLNNDVAVCHIVRPNRFFVQLPTHPSYPSLRLLDESMTQLYNTTESPPAPDELSPGMILVAKWYERWVRVHVEQPDPQGEHHLVRLVDHGGYWYFSNAEMKKIRSDFLSLPFQAIEVFLAGVQAKDGVWTQEASDVVAHICYGVIGQAQIQAYINNHTYIDLYVSIPKHGVISLADELIARGFGESVPLESMVPEEGITL